MSALEDSLKKLEKYEKERLKEQAKEAERAAALEGGTDR